MLSACLEDVFTQTKVDLTVCSSVSLALIPRGEFDHVWPVVHLTLGFS